MVTSYTGCANHIHPFGNNYTGILVILLTLSSYINSTHHLHNLSCIGVCGKPLSQQAGLHDHQVELERLQLDI